MLPDERRPAGAHAIPAPPVEPPPSVVYALRAGDRVKFGRTRNLEARLRTLQSSSPLPLGLLAVCPGAGPAEALIFRYLAPWRSHGEWFAAVPEVVAVADAMRVVAGLSSTPDYARAELFDLLTRAVELRDRRLVPTPSPALGITETRSDLRIREVIPTVDSL